MSYECRDCGTAIAGPYRCSKCGAAGLKDVWFERYSKLRDAWIDDAGHHERRENSSEPDVERVRLIIQGLWDKETGGDL